MQWNDFPKSTPLFSQQNQNLDLCPHWWVSVAIPSLALKQTSPNPYLLFHYTIWVHLRTQQGFTKTPTYWFNNNLTDSIACPTIQHCNMIWSPKFNPENFLIILQKKGRGGESHSVWSKFSILCWVAYIGVLGCMLPMSLKAKKKAEINRKL